MFLHTALERIAAAYDLDPDLLKAYAEEDLHTGWDKGAGQWPVGSLWRVEGQILYALVRARKPAQVLELGTGHGCSATHIASALAANGPGVLHCVDNSGDPTAPGRIGRGIPNNLRPHVAISDLGIEDYIANCTMTYDLIFEDGIHSPEQVYAVWSKRDTLLNPGGWLVSHDAVHFIVGKDVRAGIERAGVDDALYLDVEPSDCGLAVWRKPKRQLQVENMSAVADAFAPPDYDSWTVKQLRTELQRRDVGVPTRARKDELIDLLRQSDKVV